MATQNSIPVLVGGTVGGGAVAVGEQSPIMIWKYTNTVFEI